MNANRKADPQGWIRERVAVMPDGCWIWLGYLESGYGRTVLSEPGSKPKSIRAHQFSYQVFRGPVPEGKELDHVICDQPMCCNPWHVEPRTHRENILRGASPSAMAARQTHCKQGHPLSGDNLYEGHARRLRRCKECTRASNRESNRKYRTKRKAVSA